MGREPQIGMEVEAGRIRAIRRANSGSSNRHRDVQFECRHCGTLHWSRWSEVKPHEDGSPAHVQSCGCRSRKQFVSHFEDAAKHLEGYRRRGVFDAVSAMGSVAAAKATGESKYLCDLAYRLHLRKLGRLPREIKQKIYDLANRQHWHLAEIARRFGRSIYEIKSICRIVHDAIMAKAAAAEAAEEQAADAESVMRQAVEVASGHEAWRPTGCLSGEELICHCNGSHGGAFGAVLDLSRDILCEVDAGIRNQFRRVVRDTVNHRRALRRLFAQERAAEHAHRLSALPAAA